MRLRKIGLGNPHDIYHNSYGGLFFPSATHLPNALGMYFDRVSSVDETGLQDHFKRSYRSSYPQIPSQSNQKCSVALFTDYSSIIANSQGKIDSSLGTQPRKAFIVISSAKSDPTILDTPQVNMPEYSGYIMEAPIIRGGVPLFENNLAYIEIANGRKRGEWSSQDPALNILEKLVTEFETPVHERIFHNILTGKQKEYTRSALYDHLVETGQKDKW